MSSCASLVTWVVILLTCAMASCELLQNGGFESGMDPWHCWGMTCELLAGQQSHQGAHAVRTHNRKEVWQGPTQEIHVQAGKYYHAQSWVRILNDLPDTLGQRMELEVSFHFPDNTNRYINVAMRPLVRASDGWFLLQGEFQAPSTAVQTANFYYQGPAAGVDFAVDQASVTEVTNDVIWRNKSDDVIDRLRKSNINIHVITTGNVDQTAVKIQVLQKKKLFPFGIVVNSWKYSDPSQQNYRDFIHQHFNWAVPGNALKWRQFDWHQKPGDDTLYPQALTTLKGLKQAGLKIRGHNMVWSVADFIPVSVKAQSGDQLRATVKEHIRWTLNATRGYLEHWDVNNENLHGQWFQERLHDQDYDLELFRMMYQNDPYPKLFLNDYNVVAQGAATTVSAYLAQARRFQNANVHMYGIGVQCHFLQNQEPNPTLIKQRLDMLATVDAPIWATEVDVSVQDENLRADYIEKALRALYGHPAVEGIMFWGIQQDSASKPNALFFGDNPQPTAGGRRLLQLLESDWMTDKTVPLSASRRDFTVRGFHGDYELRVLYQDHELLDLRQNFTLGKSDHSVNVNVHA